MARFHKKRAVRVAKPGPSWKQRVAVRVSYSTNRGPGHWKAHGRYLAREAATGATHQRQVGFSQKEDKLNIATVLDGWQLANDPRLFKIIISPEFGNRMDLVKHTRSLLLRMEKDLDTALEWVGVVHTNTDNPHVHVVLRGIEKHGQELRLRREYVQSGIRAHAENLATDELGYRTEIDAVEAEKREVSQLRWTPLDRILCRRAIRQDQVLTTRVDPGHRLLSTYGRQREKHLEARLQFLAGLRLATKGQNERWELKPDVESLLRTLQASNDRQKMMAAHGALPSDGDLPQRVLSLREIKAIEGRILLHSEDERTGRRYLLLENVEGFVDLVHYTHNLEDARSSGALRVNHFVQIRKTFTQGRPELVAQDLGNAEDLLQNKEYFKEIARRGSHANTIGRQWKGWIGSYQSTLADSIAAEGRPGLTR
jgi:type IV secretory pathway VirD2 relaxase